VEPVGIDRELCAVDADHQLADILAFLSGLHYRCAAIDNDRLLQRSVAVATDDDVDARHRLGQAYVVARAVAPVLAFGDTAVTERDDPRLPSRFRAGPSPPPWRTRQSRELHRAGSTGVNLGLLAKHTKETEAEAAALDHEVGRINPSLDSCRRSSRVESFAMKSVFDESTAGIRPALLATPIALPRPSVRGRIHGCRKWWRRSPYAT